MGSLVYTGWIGGVRCMMCDLCFVSFLRSFTAIGIVLFGSASGMVLEIDVDPVDDKFRRSRDWVG